MEFKRGDIIEAVQPIRLSNGFILQTRAVGEIIAQSTDKQTVSVQFECYSGAVSVWAHLVALVEATEPTAAAQGEVVAKVIATGLTAFRREGGSITVYREHPGMHEVFVDTLDYTAKIDALEAALQQAQRERDAYKVALEDIADGGNMDKPDGIWGYDQEMVRRWQSRAMHLAGIASDALQAAQPADGEG